ncbi:MAG: hypothetical protein NTU44_02605 [Bacteroidetes bacterium]|nr:hypothetical protein [Bacteroidota bacterium]
MIRYIYILGFSLLSVCSFGRTYYSAQDGEITDASTWVAGNSPAVPNFSDTANHIYINHNVYRANTGQYYIKCYVFIGIYGHFTASSVVHIDGLKCNVEVWGVMEVHNIFYVQNAGILEVFYGGLVFTDNMIDVTGQGSAEDGYIYLHGGTICWHNNWKGQYPPDGEGVLCNSPQANMTGCCSSTGPLGIGLVSFDVSCKGKNTEFRWVTQNEENNDHFTIERSRDLDIWEKVTMVTGSLHSQGQKEYTAYDESPPSGINYYRLSQTDVDGTLTIYQDQWLRYSSCKGNETGKAFPVPAIEFTTLRYVSHESSSYRLLDVSGRQMSDGMFYLGDNILKLGDLAPGLYFVCTQWGENFSIVKE